MLLVAFCHYENNEIKVKVIWIVCAQVIQWPPVALARYIALACENSLFMKSIPYQTSCIFELILNCFEYILTI